MFKYIILLGSFISIIQPAKLIAQELDYIIHEIPGVGYQNCSAIGEDNEGAIYVGEQNGNYYKYDGENWTAMQIPSTHAFGKINAIAFDKDNVGYFVVEDDAIWILSEDGCLSINGENHDLPTSFEASGIEYDPESDVIWISTYDNGLFKIKDLTLEIMNTSNSEIPSNSLHGMTLGDDGDLWLIDWDQSLIHFSKDVFIDYNVIDEINGGFFDGVNDLDISPDNDIIIAYSDGYLRFDGESFYLIEGFYEEMDHLKIDQNGNLWGSDRHDLFFYDYENVVEYSSPLTPDDFVQSLFISSQNDLWVTGQGNRSIIQIVQTEVDVKNVVEIPEIQIFPNPTQGVVHLQQNFPIDQIVSVVAYDTMGRVKELNKIDKKSYFLKGGSAYYFLSIRLKDGSHQVVKVQLSLLN